MNELQLLIAFLNLWIEESKQLTVALYQEAMSIRQANGPLPIALERLGLAKAQADATFSTIRQVQRLQEQLNELNPSTVPNVGDLAREPGNFFG